MLSIIARPWPETDTAPDIVHSPEKEFNLFYTQEWLDEEWSRRVISDIQGFSVMDSSRHVSDILWDHHMTPNSLAGGTMNLLVFKHAFDGRKCRMSRMGGELLPLVDGHSRGERYLWRYNYLCLLQGERFAGAPCVLPRYWCHC